ncbi:MAG: redoxin domain-containing protein, partial [Deltaproteobacteria bacterium]|nr:redoxin domain-containing protein [Deltaproteobacteria bacterium]
MKPLAEDEKTANIGGRYWKRTKAAKAATSPIPFPIGWEQNIEKNFGQKIPFPVIADRNMAVAALFGLIHPGASDTATIRAVFLIDPNGKVRFLIYYPLSMGR